jgi:putative MATE family efflux protein
MDRASQLGQKSIPRLLFSFSLPAIVGMLAQALYAIIDRIFVGQAVGNHGIAGITVSFPFMLILLACGMLVGFGAAALVSIRLGEQRREEAERVLGNAAVLLVGLSLLVTVPGLWCLDSLLTRFGASPEVLPFARDYLWIIVLGGVFQIVGFGLNAVIRGEGNPKIAMLTLLIGVALNVLLAWVFIFRCGWGMQGAALATVLSQAVSAAWVVAYFLSGRSLLRLRAQHLRLQKDVCAAILSIGAPMFCMQLAASVVQSLLNHQLHRYGGDLAIAVMGAIWSVVMVIAMPMFGINQGAQPIIGYNYGARKFERVKKALQTAVLGASAIACAGFLLAMLFPAHVIRLFGNDPDLIALGTHAMRLSLSMFPIVGFQIVSASYFQAVGRPRAAVLLMLSRQVLLLIPAVLILPRFLGLNGVWAAMPAADFASSLLTGYCLLRELRHLQNRRTETRLETKNEGDPSHA